MRRLRVLLADDHALVRAGLRLLLQNNPNIESLIEATNGREALEVAKSQRPDVVLMDISMSELNGLETTARLVKVCPQTRVIILSAHSSQEYVTKALRSGASGYLLKDSAPAELDQAILAVTSGGSYLSPAVSALVIDDYVQKMREEADPLEQLTSRQRETLQLIAEGKSTKEIAYLLKVSIKTIETHRAQLMDRLGIHDVPGLVRFAIRTGLVPPEL
jgi:DNA-binding NarL/FixJ family response regulator